MPIQAIPYNTAPVTGTPFVSPGTYRVTLTVSGKTLTQPITVRQDPRVKTAAVAMQQVYSPTNALYFAAADVHAAASSTGSWAVQASKLRGTASGDVGAALEGFAKKIAALAGAPPAAGGGRGGRGGGGAPTPTPGVTDAETLWAIRSQLSGLMNSMQAADVAPTANTLAAVAAARAAAAKVVARWNALRTVELAALNARLKAAGRGQIE